MTVWSATGVLILVMDPFGNIPLFLSILKDIEPKRCQKIILRELLIALVILIFFLFLGQHALNFLNLQQESVTIAGGIILFIIGLRMIFPTSQGIMGNQPHGEPIIVPLAVPLIAGPSALATLILMVKSNPSQTMNYLIALIIAWAVTAVVLLGAPFLYRILHERGLTAIERLMGMILIMLSVQMLLNGIRGYLQEILIK